MDSQPLRNPLRGETRVTSFFDQRPWLRDVVSEIADERDTLLHGSPVAVGVTVQDENFFHAVEEEPSLQVERKSHLTSSRHVLPRDQTLQACSECRQRSTEAKRAGSHG